MNKKIIIFIILALVLVAGGTLGFFSLSKQKQVTLNKSTPKEISYKDTAYEINGNIITLKNGYAETPVAPNSVSKMITKYFGNEVKADINGDGKEDVAFLLTQDGGGSGTFYYVVAAIKKSGGYEGTNAIFIGDRIAPQTTEFRDGVLTVNYADRNPGESFSVRPSLGKSLYIIYKFGKLELHPLSIENMRQGEYPR